MAVLDQIVDVERSSGEVLQNRVHVRGEEASELWRFLLLVSSRWTELPALPLLVIQWQNRVLSIR